MIRISIICLAFVIATCRVCTGETDKPVIPSKDIQSSGEPARIEPDVKSKISKARVFCPTMNEEARLLYNSALEFEQQEQYADAQERYLKAIEKDPGYCDAMDNVGQMFRRKGDLKQAISWYKRSLAVKPDNSVAHQNLAVAYRIQGDADNTLAEYQWLVRNDPDNPEGYYGLGMTFIELGQPSAAIKALHRAVELYHANSSTFLGDAQFLLGAAYYDQKDFRNARDYLLLSYPSRKEDPDANYLLGLCYLGPPIKNSVKAREYLLKAQQLGAKVSPELIRELDK
jgi:tetratricopeptide (TPR) repeat protein